MVDEVELQAQEIENIATQAIEIEEVARPGITLENNEPKTSEILFPLFDFAFGSRAPNWNVQSSEVQGLADAYGALIDKYLPDGFGFAKYGEEIAVITMTASVLLPRKDIPLMLKEVESEKDGD